MVAYPAVVHPHTLVVIRFAPLGQPTNGSRSFAGWAGGRLRAHRKTVLTIAVRAPDAVLVVLVPARLADPAGRTVLGTAGAEHVVIVACCRMSPAARSFLAISRRRAKMIELTAASKPQGKASFVVEVSRGRDPARRGPNDVGSAGGFGVPARAVPAPGVRGRGRPWRARLAGVGSSAGTSRHGLRDACLAGGSGNRRSARQPPPKRQRGVLRG